MSNSEKTLKDIKKRRAKKKVLLKIFLGVSACIFFVIATGFIASFYFLIKDIPGITSLKDYRPSIITKIYADNNELIDEFYLEDRKVIRVTELPKFAIQAFVAAEDARFFQHRGIDFQGIMRAFLKNLEAGTIVQGGSTITQQVAKSLFLSPERSYTRKLKEAILAYKIERYLNKYEILNLYLNQIYLGHGTYGIEAASQKYFGKSAQHLTLPEATLLAGLPKAPNRYSPINNPKRARSRQVYVLNRLAEDGYITEEEKIAALKVPLELKESTKEEKIAPYFTEHVRRYIQERYGTNVLYREGLEVYTTLNIDMQKAANSAIIKGLSELDKRQGYRGPLKKIQHEEFTAFLEELHKKVGNKPLIKGQITTAIVTSLDSKQNIVELKTGTCKASMTLKNMSWARKPNKDIAYNVDKVKDPADVFSVGDVINVKVLDIVTTNMGTNLNVALEQEPVVQGALLCMDAKTGEIKAMIGGKDYNKSEFNRATQSRRQPGSAFKPFIYAAAFDKGMTPATVVMDTPVIYKDTLQDSLWKPQNYEEKFYGPTILRTALVKSRNLVTIKLLKDIGIDYAADYVKNLGIRSPLTKDLSMALGTTGVTLLEIIRGYGVFANEGKRVNPLFIRKIVDRTGHVFEEHKPEIEQAVDPRIAFITAHLLTEVVQSGTGRRVKALGRPVAGKTGTTNDLRDAWFIGFTPSLVAGVWVGFDNRKPLGKYETGSRAASPIFLYFMKKVLDGTPIECFSPPEGIVFTKIDPETGLLAKPNAKKYIFECFLEGSAPTEYTPNKNSHGEKDIFMLDMRDNGMLKE